MRWSKFGVYRHMSCLDVDILVLNCGYRGPTYSYVRVKYVLRDGRDLRSNPETVKIYNSDSWKWKRVS